ncbi:MAG: nucleotidyltransferase family protein [Ilumatobacteraceae bacterium]
MSDEIDGRTGPHAGQTQAAIAIVVLAAGAGSRFRAAGHKLSAELPATASEPAATVLERALTHALAADVGPVIVVTGAAPDAVPPHLRSLVHEQHNPRWSDGQMTSLRAGLERAATLGASAVVVGLGDQPFIDPSAWRTMAAATGRLAVATYDGTRGNPVRLDQSIWDLLPEDGDEGARAVMRVRPDLVSEVPCTGSPADIDTTEDLRRWQSN